VSDHEFGGGPNGDYDRVTKAIRIEAKNSENQRVKTLAHELGHALLHGGGETEDILNSDPKAREFRELEAESPHSWFAKLSTLTPTITRWVRRRLGWRGEKLLRTSRSPKLGSKARQTILEPFEKERERRAEQDLIFSQNAVHGNCASFSVASDSAQELDTRARTEYLGCPPRQPRRPGAL